MNSIEIPPVPGATPILSAIERHHRRGREPCRPAKPAGEPERPVLSCFNVKFSPNLGDGLLSECLEAALIEAGADRATKSIDLAGRRTYGEAASTRRAALNMLQALPPPLRRMAVRLPLAINARRKWRPHYSESLNGSDGVVIGGGNLISDLDLNFPTKLPLALEEAERRGLPAVIYACGVGDAWSETGLRRCRRAFQRPQLRAIFVRDEDSKVLWDRLMGSHTGLTAEVVRDPGLLASALYPRRDDIERERDRPVAGLGIISPIAVRYHSLHAPTAQQLGRWFVEVTRGLVLLGFQVSVFTNGSPEDRAFAETLRGQFQTLGGPDQIAFLQQRDPRGLCAHIRDFDILIAHRMHAVIAAYSYGVPALALEWDRKLNSFMRSVGREAHMADVTSLQPENAVARVVEIWRAGIPEAERATVVAEARADVGRLFSLYQREDGR